MTDPTDTNPTPPTSNPVAVMRAGNFQAVLYATNAAPPWVLAEVALTQRDETVADGRWSMADVAVVHAILGEMLRQGLSMGTVVLGPPSDQPTKEG